MTHDKIPIGDLARRAGLRPSAIRYYEEIGLLPTPERASGRRRYGNDTLQRLAVIAAARRGGLRLREIAELLDAEEHGVVSASLQEMARRKLPEVIAAIERTQLVQAWLEAAADCRCPTLADCPLFDQPPRAGAPLTGRC